MNRPGKGPLEGWQRGSRAGAEKPSRRQRGGVGRGTQSRARISGLVLAGCVTGRIPTMPPAGVVGCKQSRQKCPAHGRLRGTGQLCVLLGQCSRDGAPACVLTHACRKQVICRGSLERPGMLSRCADQCPWGDGPAERWAHRLRSRVQKRSSTPP